MEIIFERATTANLECYPLRMPIKSSGDFQCNPQINRGRFYKLSDLICIDPQLKMRLPSYARRCDWTSILYKGNRYSDCRENAKTKGLQVHLSFWKLKPKRRESERSHQHMYQLHDSLHIRYPTHSSSSYRIRLPLQDRA